MTQNELQVKMQRLTPDYQEKFKEQHNKWMNDTEVSVPSYEKFNLYRQFAMMHESEARLNVAYKYWKHLFHNTVDVWYVQDIATLLAAMQFRTLKEWLNTVPYDPTTISTKSIEDWTDFKACVQSLEDIVNPMINKFTEDLLKKLMTQQHLALSGQTKSIPLHKQ